MFWKRRPKRSQDRDDPPEIPRIEAADSGWGVPLLDIRPVTTTMLSASENPQCARNHLSFRTEDGTSFRDDTPAGSREVRASLQYPVDRMLSDGPLFVPQEMEHKWAIFCLEGRLLFVRSWTRTLSAVADLETGDGFVEITRIRGTLYDEDVPPGWTVRAVEFLIRSHALGQIWPAPLLPDLEADPYRAALWCMAGFGSLAHVATAHEFERIEPDRPLRSNSLLHIAVAREDLAGVEAQLSAGVPIDLLAGDGSTPLHWAVSVDASEMAGELVERGSGVDVRSDEGATPLMVAVQDGKAAMVAWLLERGADANARDHRGFTALHRAAETGQVDFVRTLLAAGAVDGM